MDKVNNNIISEVEKERTVKITKEDILRYIADLEEKGRSHITVRKYRRMLNQMYDSLPEDKVIHKDTFMNSLLGKLQNEEYSVSTVNSAITAYNGFLRFKGYSDFTISWISHESEEVPEMNHDDYMKLLKVAKASENREGYLLIKLFANTLIKVHEMDCVTVEAIQEGVIVNEGGEKISIGKVLQREFLSFAEKEYRRKGPLFRTGSGNTYDRHQVTRHIHQVGIEAGFPEGFITPRNLHRFYLQRMGGIREQFEAIILQALENVQEAEMALVSWND